MKYRVGIAVGILILIVGGYVWFMGRHVYDPQADLEAMLPSLPDSPLYASFLFDGQEVALTDGRAEHSLVDGGSSRTTVFVVGEPIYGDVTDDGIDDATLILAQEGGGSGTFYYVATAFKDSDGYIGSNALYLGDRINVQHVAVAHGVIRVQFNGRASDTPFTDPATVPEVAYAIAVQGFLERVDTDDAVVREGLLSYGENRWTYAPCGQQAGTVSDTSRSFAALQAVYAQRSTQESTPIFMTILTHAQEAAGGTIYDVVRILSVPKQGVCDNANQAVNTEDSTASTPPISPIDDDLPLSEEGESGFE